MTEVEWVTAAFAERQSAVTVLGLRRARLFAVSACLSLGRWSNHSAIVASLSVAERVADGRGSIIDLRRARQRLRRAREECEAAVRGWRDYRQANAFECAAAAVSEEKAGHALLVATSALQSLDRPPNVVMYQLYAEIAGPADFRFAPAWLIPTVEAIAAGAYADRAFDRLPVLADALEDAGCDAADLLAHLRGPGPHARGCWALDAVLGKA